MDYFISNNYWHRVPFQSIKMKHLILVFILINAFCVDSQSHHGDDKSPLQIAIESKDLSKVKQLVEAGEDVNLIGDWRETPIDWAIKANDIAIVKYLLSKGAAGKSGLEDAIRNNNKEMVFFLVENNFSLYQTVIYAAEKNNLEFVKLLVSKGASVNESQKRKKKLFSKYYVSAIEFATEHKNTEMALFLMENGVSNRDAINNAISNNHIELLKSLIKKGKEKDLILLLSFQSNMKEVIDYAIKNGANVLQKDEHGTSLLHIAASSGITGNVQRCIDEFKIDINSKTNESVTPLMLACEKGKIEVVQLLLGYKAELEVENNLGETAIFYSTRDRSSTAFDFLVNAGANLLHKTRSNKTILIEACIQTNSSVIKTLLNDGADIDAFDDNKRKAFNYAVGKVQKDIIQLFLDKGADINTTNAENGQSLMYIAIDDEKLDEIIRLKSLGANIDVKDRQGNRPRNDDKEIIKYLVENGADINASDSRGDSFLCNAVGSNDLELVHYLVTKGADVNQNCYFDEPPIIKAIKKESITLVTFLADNKADINAIGYFDRNVAEYAEKEGNQEIINFLKGRGALTKSGQNELYKRSMQMESDLKSALINSNENLLISHLKNAGGLPIQTSLIDKIAVLASEVGNPIILELLIDKLKFNVDSPLNYDKQTALFIATINDKPTVVSYLIGKKANLNLEDRNGKIALDYAKGKSMKRLFKN